MTYQIVEKSLKTFQTFAAVQEINAAAWWKSNKGASVLNADPLLSLQCQNVAMKSQVLLL